MRRVTRTAKTWQPRARGSSKWRRGSPISSVAAPCSKRSSKRCRRRVHLARDWRAKCNDWKRPCTMSSAAARRSWSSSEQRRPRSKRWRRCRASSSCCPPASKPSSRTPGIGPRRWRPSGLSTPLFVRGLTTWRGGGAATREGVVSAPSRCASRMSSGSPARLRRRSSRRSAPGWRRPSAASLLGSSARRRISPRRGAPRPHCATALSTWMPMSGRLANSPAAAPAPQPHKSLKSRCCACSSLTSASSSPNWVLPRRGSRPSRPSSPSSPRALEKSSTGCEQRSRAPRRWCRREERRALSSGSRPRVRSGACPRSPSASAESKDSLRTSWVPGGGCSSWRPWRIRTSAPSGR
mmetsp:Transcript_27456/g.77961  ORF Transcript_27456/g.77961 Transcript_27456/m.77961 type:complete len:352 (+) Transcript_27456:1055-2110(+)